MPMDTKGGMRTFAASAKSKGQREESGRSGLRPSFFDVRTQRMVARSQNLPALQLQHFAPAEI
jgi:hypothetical protein